MVKKRVRDIKRRDEEMEKNSRQVLQRKNKAAEKRKAGTDEFSAQKDFVQLTTTTTAAVSKKPKATTKATTKATAKATATATADFHALQKAVESEKEHEKSQSEAKTLSVKDKAKTSAHGAQKGDANKLNVADLQRDFTLDKGTTDKIVSSVASLPTPAQKPKRGVIYLGHIPHGFFEPQMKAFFSQFGVVKNLRLFRNEKTGRSRQYAFIEFENEQIAKIVADTMNGYILFERTLKSEVIPREKVNLSAWSKPPTSRLYRKTRPAAVKKHNAPKTEGKIQKNQKMMIAKETKKRDALTKLGISYDFPGYAALVSGAKEEPKKEEPKKEEPKKQEPKKEKKTNAKSDKTEKQPTATVSDEKKETATKSNDKQQAKANSGASAKQTKNTEAAPTTAPAQTASSQPQSTPKKTKASRK
eukprot:TRINITY_DN4205_c0_g1_i4.p1 TRINITY_DN4205_c0_g1~~TRINITY_DN4205_c0_g1_i4.p1  ORF type:complete len:416 (-),score=132.89 TRINITY_DN4205_c0_g1_i4:283-1530(-)